MSQSNTYDRLLDLEYEDVMRSCHVNDESRLICQDPIFWEEKAQRDYKTSLRQVRSEKSLKPREKYLVILSERDVTRGSENFISPEECLRRAVVTGRSDLCEYFIDQGDLDLSTALVEATKDKSIFDSLVKTHRVDIYADPEFIYDILRETIRHRNFPLLREIAPRGFAQIADQKDAESLMETAVQTGQYEYVDYIHPFYYPVDQANQDEINIQAEDLDEWLLQTGILKGDTSLVEPLIEDMIGQDRIEGLTRALVRSGDYKRLEALIHLEQFEGLSSLGEDILLDAAKYDRVDILRLVKEDPVFQLVRRRSWFERAFDQAKISNSTNALVYLSNVLHEM